MDIHSFSIHKGMCGLKEEAILAYEQLHTYLSHYPFNTPCMWHHTTQCKTFNLAVDYYGIIYFHNAEVKHLFFAIWKKYSIIKDRTGSTYLGQTINWDYDKGYVDISMPDYLPKALAKCNHKLPRHPQHAPYLWIRTVLVKKRSMLLRVRLRNSNNKPPRISLLKSHGSVLSLWCRPLCHAMHNFLPSYIQPHHHQA